MLLNVVSHYDLSFLSMSVWVSKTNLDEGGGGGWAEFYPGCFRDVLTFFQLCKAP